MRTQKGRGGRVVQSFDLKSSSEEWEIKYSGDSVFFLKSDYQLLLAARRRPRSLFFDSPEGASYKGWSLSAVPFYVSKTYSNGETNLINAQEEEEEA